MWVEVLCVQRGSTLRTYHIATPQDIVWADRDARVKERVGVGDGEDEHSRSWGGGIRII